MSLVPWVVCLGVVAPAANATTLVPATLDEIVAGAELVVHGRVVGVRSEMTAGRRSIHSYVTLAVDEAVKGRPGPTVTFRVPNGQVGRYRRVVIGAPEFVVGDEVIVFLRARAPAVPTLFGLSQGVYRVRRGDAARVAAAGRFLGRVRLLAAEAGR
jgi:hypothetical protein